MPKTRETTKGSPSQVLEGIRVADVSMHYAGPTCTRILADMGAEVIKVESIQRPDIGTRRLVPADNEFGERWWEHSGYFVKRNINKYGVTLDLSRPEGAELLKKLVRISDVVVENYTPRVMRQFGLDYNELKKVKPEIIMLSLSGYGQYGPYRDRVALGPGLEASCGLASLTGYPGGPPSLSGLSYFDAMSGVAGASAVLVALLYRKRTGKGQYIDLSEQESVIPSFAGAIMDYTMNKRVPERIGNRHSSMVPHGCYRCRGHQAWVTITVSSDEEWEGLCRAMGNPSWTKDEKFATTLARSQNHDELDQLIEQWIMQFDRFDVMRLLQQESVPAGAVLSGKDLLFDPHLKKRGFFQVVDHAAVGKRPYPRQIPVKFSRFTSKKPKPAPTLGEDNSYLLRDLLGLPERKVAQLEKDGIIGTRPARLEQVRPRSWLRLDRMDRAGVIRYEPDYLRQLSAYYHQRLGVKNHKARQK